MVWKKHPDGVPNVLIPNANILSKKACASTLGKPNRSFVAFSYNILILLEYNRIYPLQKDVIRTSFPRWGLTAL